MEGAETRPIFRWDGKYAGFVFEGHLYDRWGNYWGWVDEEGNVWRSQGALLGELVEENYVLRKVGQERRKADPRTWPDRPAVPGPSANRPPKEPKEGWEDALEDLTHPSGLPRINF